MYWCEQTFSVASLFKCLPLIMRNSNNDAWKRVISHVMTHVLSGSTRQSPSHSQPTGGKKYSCFSFTLPVTSENLLRFSRPVVPHFPRTWAWFSYCERDNEQTLAQDSRLHLSRSKSIKAIFTNSANTLKIPSAYLLNFISSVASPSHMLTRNWTGIFKPFLLSMGYCWEMVIIGYFPWSEV